MPVVEQISSLEILSVVEQIRSVENFVRCRVDQRGRFCPLSSKFQRGIFRPLSSKFQRGKFVRCRANQRGKLSVEEQISVENCPLSSKSSWKNCPLSSKSAWKFVRCRAISVEILSIVERISVENFVRCRVCHVESVLCGPHQRGNLSVVEQIGVEICPLSSKSAWTFVRVPRVCAIRPTLCRLLFCLGWSIRAIDRRASCGIHVAFFLYSLFFFFLNARVRTLSFFVLLLFFWVPPGPK